MEKKPIYEACCLLPTHDLQADVAFFTKDIGFELVSISPAGDPIRAELSGFGLAIRLDTQHVAKDSGCIVIKTAQVRENDQMRSPGGTVIIRETVKQASQQTIEQHQTEVCTLRTSPWIAGQAGTQTRELIPSRLGGAILAKHFRIPNGGPVVDRVHYHTANFQLVFCVRGWIKLVYEDQGEPITLSAGECVTQPPHIRHRVLETSNGLEVLEIGLPADHVTAIDNAMELPTLRVDSHRLFDGQRFCRFRQSDAKWQRHRLPGFVSCDTGVAQASENLAGVRLLKSTHSPSIYSARHSANVLFSYVLAGSVRVNNRLMVAGDAYTLPPGEDHSYCDLSTDVSILELSVPGEFETRL